ncbi:hypothetical protein GPALN_012491 [Globodera pallida]|nr:hypothetical protein GPALN_012491 [Globodera pallida]
MFPSGVVPSADALPGVVPQQPKLAQPQKAFKKAKDRRASRVRLPQFIFTSPADSSREPSPGGGESGTEQHKILKVVGAPRRQLSEHTLLRPSVSFLSSNNNNNMVDESARRRHSGQDGANQQRVPFGVVGADKRSSERVERLPLRAFKKIGRVGTLPALAHTSAASTAIQSVMSSADEATTPALTSGGGASSTRTAGGGSAFQRWGGHINRRAGSHMVGWDSARPQSAARQQQQLLERLYSKSELHEYQQLFRMFDTDGSGAIGCEELKGAMLSIGLQADDSEIERLIKEVDEDGNGEIDFPEFCQCMKRSQQSGGIRGGRLSNEEVARQCFEVFDQDCNGLITENEFIYVAKEVGGFSQQLAEFVFRELLGDSATGQLDQTRFSAIVDDYLFSDGGSGGGNDGESKSPDASTALSNVVNDF